MNILLIGPGKNRIKAITFSGDDTNFSNDDTLTSIDMDPSSNPDFLMDLNEVFPDGKLPFNDETFDEIHAYNVLEHIGRQGDWKGYFKEFEEYHRILKNNGKFFILVPILNDAIADPGHSRFFHRNHFGFLNQNFYTLNKEKTTSATDYRWFWKKNFEIDFIAEFEGHHLAVILRKYEIS